MFTASFFYTEGVSFKATNVLDISSDDNVVQYSQLVENTGTSVTGMNLRSVDKSDLLYVVVKNTETNELSIIPGLYDSFEVTPTGPAVYRQQNIEREADRVAANREAKAPARNAKEAEKYAARRAARKAQHIKTTVQPGDGTTEVTGKGKTATIDAQIKAAGISQADIEVLRSLNIMK